jgi:hypothetical protein
MPAFVRPRRLAAAGAAALALAAGVVAPVQAAPAPGWHIGRILRYCGNDGMLAVAAIGARDAWALGQPEAAPRCGADVEHWNGRAWQRVPVPRTAEFGIEPGAPPVTATSARNAWLFPVREATIGVSTFSTTTRCTGTGPPGARRVSRCG